MSAETDGFAVAEMPDTPRMPAAPSNGERVIASFNAYDGLLDGLRSRALELQASGEVLDEVSGLARGYFQKLIGPKPPRRLGMRSLGDVLGALGVRCVIIEDPEAMNRVTGRLKKRNLKMVRDAAWQVTITRRFMQKIGRIGGTRRMEKMTKAERQQLARQAALARWASSP
jgi:hypothetical protein